MDGEVLVTGGAGFIGGHISLRLNDAGYDVVVLDNLERASPFGIKMLTERGINLVKSDLRTASLGNLLKGINAVVHVAAYISVEESLKKPLAYFENNVQATVRLLNACVKSKVDKIIYISSAAVYGEPVQTPIDESHPTNPISPYGASKLCGEIAVKMFSKCYGFSQTILRLFNVYGPGQRSSYAGVITKFLERALQGLPPVIFGDGLQTRDFVYVADVAEAVKLALEKDKNGVFNIGCGKPVSIVELANLIIDIFNISEEPIYVAPRPGDIRNSYASIRKAQEELGYNPGWNLRKGLKETVKWLMEAI